MMCNIFEKTKVANPKTSLTVARGSVTSVRLKRDRRTEYGPRLFFFRDWSSCPSSLGQGTSRKPANGRECAPFSLGRSIVS